MKRKLMPLEVGKNVIMGYEGKILVAEDHLFIECLTNPVYRNERWTCLAQVNSSLCIIEVTPFIDD